MACTCFDSIMSACVFHGAYSFTLTIMDLMGAILFTWSINSKVKMSTKLSRLLVLSESSRFTNSDRDCVAVIVSSFL